MSSDDHLTPGGPRAPILAIKHGKKSIHNETQKRNTKTIFTFLGQSKVVLKPRSTAEVSKIVKYCNDKHLAVCPQGGNTGLVGGSVPVFDEVVLCLGLLNKIISLDEISGTLYLSN